MMSSTAVATKTVDIRTLDGCTNRKACVLETFDALDAGESVEVVNDHLPRGLLLHFQEQRPGAFGEMAIIADIDAYLGVLGLKHRVPEIARAKEELLPEPGGMRDMGLTVLTEVTAIGIDDGGRIVQHAGLFLFIDWYHDDHTVFLGVLRHQLHRGTGYRFRGLVPLHVLARAEIRRGEDFLQAQDLHTLLAGLLDEGDMLVQHGLFDLLNRSLPLGHGKAGLDQAGFHDSGHVCLL